MNKGGVLFKGNKSICYLKKEGMMPDNVVENKEEVFIIRLVGMKPGTSSGFEPQGLQKECGPGEAIA
jgi:hypothetical protein